MQWKTADVGEMVANIVFSSGNTQIKSFGISTDRSAITNAVAAQSAVHLSKFSGFSTSIESAAE
jgi:3-keto-L-gulonate-6-phosphate decarboxylase